MTNNNHKYPQIVGFRELPAISFTSYYGMKGCMLKGLPYRCIDFTPNTPTFHMNRRQLLGILYHRILEDIPSILQLPFNRRADRLCELLEQHSIAIEKSNFDNPHLLTLKLQDLPELGPLFQNLSYLVFEIINDNSNVSKTSIEVTLNSADNQLVSILDVLQQQGSEWIITEHKSCRIFEDGVLKSKFNLQAHFYSQLVYEVYGKYPIMVKIVGIDGIFLVNPDRAYCEEIARDARSMLSTYNSKRVLDDCQQVLTNATKNNCIDCAYQAYCQTYWNSLSEIAIEKPRAIRFRLLETLQSRGKNRTNLRVKLLATLGSKQYTLGNYYPDKYAGLELTVGTEYVATKVTLNSRSNTGNFSADNSLYELSNESR